LRQTMVDSWNCLDRVVLKPTIVWMGRMIELVSISEDGSTYKRLYFEPD